MGVEEIIKSKVSSFTKIKLDDFIQICSECMLSEIKELITKVEGFKNGTLTLSPDEQYDLIYYCSIGGPALSADKIKLLLSMFDEVYSDTIRIVLRNSSLTADDLIEFVNKMTLKAKITLARKVSDPSMLDRIVECTPNNQLRVLVNECFINFCLSNKDKLIGHVLDLYSNQEEVKREKVRDL